MKFLHKISSISIILFLLFSRTNLNAQNAAEIFGKNKVQYNNDQYDWWIYETNNFVYYWYGKSRPSAQFCIEIAETENSLIQKLFEYHLRDKIELIIYADASDLTQSNLDFTGITNEENWNLEPKIKDQKILLYFNGDHNNLRNLLRTGITKVYFNSMFTGTALQDVVQKVISLKLPDWFENGLIQYLSTGWKEEHQIQFFSLWKKNKFKKFSTKYPELAGTSFWNFLTTSYGEQAISNWLYMTRIQKDIQLAAKSVFSLTFNELLSDWYTFYLNQEAAYQKYNTAYPNLTHIHLKPEETIINFQFNRNNNKTILLTQQNNKARVYEIDTTLKNKKRIFSKGSRSKLNKTDFTYPIYTYPENENYYGIIYEKRNRVYINIYDEEKKTKIINKLPEDFQRVYSAASINKNEFIFSANINGLTDIVHYNIKLRQYKKLTNDIWDDLDVKISKEKRSTKIIFRSNRPEANNNINKIDSTLPLNRFKLFSIEFNNPNELASKTLVADIPDQSIRSWQLYQNAFLCEIENEHSNYWLYLKNDKTFPINVDKQIILLNTSRDTNAISFITKEQNKYFLKTIKKIEIRQDLILSENETNITDSDTLDKIITKLSSQDTSFFQSRFGNPGNIVELLKEFENKSSLKITLKTSTISKYKNENYPNVIDFNSNLAIAYRNRFYISELSATLNNELLFSGLNTFSGTSLSYEPPPIGVLFKTKLEEIFENYTLEAGLRIPTNFKGLEAYMQFENRKKRMDHIYAIYYKTNTDVFSSNLQNNLKEQSNTFLLNYQLKFAFDHYRSIRAINTLRNDHVFYLSTNLSTLEEPLDRYQQRIGTRIEFVYDNSIDVSLNIKNGWQLKVFTEVSKRFDLYPGSKSKFYPGALWISGFDARYHIPLLTKSVFSNRIFSNISYGHDRILFHVGGTENWLLPKYENQNPISSSGEYTYSALATEVRSYGYGARKGSSVLGISSELRIPFLQYLLNENWKNNILRNFQFISFLDAAVVWDGFIPQLDKISTLNYHAENPAVKVDLEYVRPPYIAGIGLGLRTSVFGYFIRFDHAWKLTSSGLEKPKYSFSLGLDF